MPANRAHGALYNRAMPANHALLSSGWICPISFVLSLSKGTKLGFDKLSPNGNTAN